MGQFELAIPEFWVQHISANLKVLSVQEKITTHYSFL